MKTQHASLSGKQWQTLSLYEQLGNIGSEVNRVMRWQGKDQDSFENAVDRALELFDLTLADSRWQGRRKEIARAREVFCDAVLGGKEYKSLLKDLNQYFYWFALAARNKK